MIAVRASGVMGRGGTSLVTDGHYNADYIYLVYT
jgi:hypothetical protein